MSVKRIEIRDDTGERYAVFFFTDHTKAIDESIYDSTDPDNQLETTEQYKVRLMLENAGADVVDLTGARGNQHDRTEWDAARERELKSPTRLTGKAMLKQGAVMRYFLIYGDGSSERIAKVDWELRQAPLVDIDE